MQLINKFHRMELEEKLFDIGKNEGLPLWDIIRYHVYLKYYYPEDGINRLSIAGSHTYSDYLKLLKNALGFVYKILFARGENVVITSSRNIDSNGKYFDKSAISIIEALADNCLVVEPVLSKRIAYSFIYDFSCVFSRFHRSKQFPYEYYNKLNEVLIRHLQKCLISYEEVNNIYHSFQSDYNYFKVLFKAKSTKRLFVSTGNPKGILLAAKEHGITTYLLQHSDIGHDGIEHSYPGGISNNSNILFSDVMLTYGDYWCKKINVPSKEILPIGNDYFYSKPIIHSDNSILIISTIIHGEELKPLTKQLAVERPDLKFVFKLHPNEYRFYDDYIVYFKSNMNVSVFKDQLDISKLIAKSQLVILIVSGVLYEALNQNKKVAVYKRINYKRQLHLADFPNIFFINNAKEVVDIIDKPITPSVVNFYKPINDEILKRVCFGDTNQKCPY